MQLQRERDDRSQSCVNVEPGNNLSILQLLSRAIYLILTKLRERGSRESEHVTNILTRIPPISARFRDLSPDFQILHLPATLINPRLCHKQWSRVS